MTEGGGQAGMGHIMRCLSLVQAFAASGNIATMIVNGTAKAPAEIAKENWLSVNWLSETDPLIGIIKDADIVVVDSYKCTVELYREIEGNSKLTAYIDDENRVDYPGGVVINGVMGAEKMNYPAKNGVQYLLGNQYSFLRKEFWDVTDKLINNTITKVMITCGGNDADGLSLKIVKLLTEKNSALQLSVVLNADANTPVEEYKKYATVLNGLSSSEMKELMMDSDLAITASGQTTYELCRTGTPFIALITAQNQAFSIGNFYTEGLTQEPIAFDDPLLAEKITKQFDALADPFVRRNIQTKMKNSIGGKGSINVVAELLKTTDKNNTDDTRRN